MEIEKHLAELAQADPQARRTALENALTAEGLTPEIQECEADERRKAARNYLLYTADKDAKGPPFSMARNPATAVPNCLRMAASVR